MVMCASVCTRVCVCVCACWRKRFVFVAGHCRLHLSQVVDMNVLFIFLFFFLPILFVLCLLLDSKRCQTFLWALNIPPLPCYRVKRLIDALINHLIWWWSWAPINYARFGWFCCLAAFDLSIGSQSVADWDLWTQQPDAPLSAVSAAIDRQPSLVSRVFIGGRWQPSGGVGSD